MKISVSGRLGGRPVAVSLIDCQLTGDPLLRSMVTLYAARQWPVQLPGVIEGPACLDDDQLASATLYSVLDPGTAELAIEPRPWWLISGRVVGSCAPA